MLPLMNEMTASQPGNPRPSTLRLLNATALLQTAEGGELPQEEVRTLQPAPPQEEAEVSGKGGLPKEITLDIARHAKKKAGMLGCLGQRCAALLKKIFPGLILKKGQMSGLAKAVFHPARIPKGPKDKLPRKREPWRAEATDKATSVNILNNYFKTLFKQGW